MPQFSDPGQHQPRPLDTSQPARNGQGVGLRHALSDAAYPCEPGQIKGNRNSRIYHVPGGAFYTSTRANVACFDSEGEAAAAGFRRRGGRA